MVQILPNDYSVTVNKFSNTALQIKGVLCPLLKGWGVAIYPCLSENILTKVEKLGHLYPMDIFLVLAYFIAEIGSYNQ